MRENIYLAPKSNLKIEDGSRGSPVKAISVGILISFVGSLVGAMLVGIGFGVFLAANGMGTEEIDVFIGNDTSVLLAYILEASIFSVWAGYYIAKKTNHREYFYCLILVLISTLLGVVLMVAVPTTLESQPLWYTITSFIAYPITVFAGCKLKLRSGT